MVCNASFIYSFIHLFIAVQLLEMRLPNNQASTFILTSITKIFCICICSALKESPILLRTLLNSRLQRT